MPNVFWVYWTIISVSWLKLSWPWSHLLGLTFYQKWQHLDQQKPDLLDLLERKGSHNLTYSRSVLLNIKNNSTMNSIVANVAALIKPDIITSGDKLFLKNCKDAQHIAEASHFKVGEALLSFHSINGHYSINSSVLSQLQTSIECMEKIEKVDLRKRPGKLQCDFPSG